MGACQSRTVDGAALRLPSKSQGSSIPTSKPRNALRTKLIIIPSRDRNVESIMSPSEKTDATDPMTPSSMLTSPLHQAHTFSASTPSSEEQKLEPLDEDNEEYHGATIDYNASSLEASLTLGSQLGGAVIDSVIAEEESLGAPSDEEDAHQELQSKKQSEAQTAADNSVPALENELYSSRPKGGERQVFFTRPNEQPALSQSGVKLLSKRITTPESIIHRPPLLAPPQGAEVDQLCVVAKSSVNPQTIAHFNRLKIQVQLANRAEKQRQHKEKVQDRIEDVKGYRNLWSEYEIIQNQVQVQDQTEATREETSESPQESLNLKDSKSWYFDFQALQMGELDDDDDNQSMTSMSLLSDANMEVQRKIFKEKRKVRKERKSKKKTKRERRDMSDERSVGSINSSVSRKSVVYIRGQQAEADYGPLRQVTIPGEVCVDSDDDTPKATASRADTLEFGRAEPCHDDSSVVSDLDMDNDYNVPRRRRRHHNSTNAQDDQSVSTMGERSLEELGLSQADMGIMTDLIPSTREFSAPKSVEVKTNTPKAPDGVEKYGFDPSAPLSSQIDVLTMPSVQIDSADTGVVRWRQFCTSDEENFKFGSAARRLEDLYGAVEDNAEDRDVSKQSEQIAHPNASSAEEGGTARSTAQQDDAASRGAEVDPVLDIDSAPSATEQTKDDEGSLSSKESGNIEGGKVDDQSSGLTDKPRVTDSKDVCTARRSLSSGQCKEKVFQGNPYEGLTSDQFLMLSSLPRYEGEVNEKEDRIDSQDDARRPQEDRDAANETEKRAPEGETPPPTEASAKKTQSTISGTYKPVIDYMSTEAFLFLSAAKVSDDSSHPEDDGSDGSQALSDQQPILLLDEQDHPNGKWHAADSDSSVSVGLPAKRSVTTEVGTEQIGGSPAPIQTHDCQAEAGACDTECAQQTVSVDDCDLLANDLSTQIDKLLSEFRQGP